jgi:hypothetical protein
MQIGVEGIENMLMVLQKIKTLKRKTLEKTLFHFSLLGIWLNGFQLELSKGPLLELIVILPKSV